MRQLIRRFAKCERATTAIEYSIIAAGLSIVILAAVQGIGAKIVTTFSSVQTAVK
jgi:pilus assembly protein Flp/PilA